MAGSSGPPAHSVNRSRILIDSDRESSLDVQHLVGHAEPMVRIVVVKAWVPPAMGRRLTQRRVVDFGLTGAMRCR
jgi:hypothetical protein